LDFLSTIYDRKTFYTFDFHGYTDYPFYDQQRDGLLSDPFCPQFHDTAFYFDSRLHASLAQASAISSPRSESKNKTLVLEAFDTLFNKRDYVAGVVARIRRGLAFGQEEAVEGGS